MANGDIVLIAPNAGGDIFFEGTPPEDIVLSPNGIATQETFGTASVTPGSVSISPAGILTQEVFGLATVFNTLLLNPNGIASQEIFGLASVTTNLPRFLAKLNNIEQKTDVRGSRTKNDDKNLLDEVKNYGALTDNSGSSASINVSGSTVTITGLTGMTASSIGNYLVLSNTNDLDNLGGFLITTVNDSNSVVIENENAVTDANNGSIVWEERETYSLEDDLNFVRTDRKNIKGTSNYYSDAPQYTRPDNTNIFVNTNLTNIAGKTADAIAFVFDKIDRGVSVAESDTSVTITMPGSLKHADSDDTTGVPIFDGFDADNHNGTFVKIVDASNGQTLTVQSGGNAGKLVYGRTKKGSSTSPNSVEIEFRAVGFNQDLEDSVSYAWEGAQPTSVNLIYGYRERLDRLDENAFRMVLNY